MSDPGSLPPRPKRPQMPTTRSVPAPAASPVEPSLPSSEKAVSPAARPAVPQRPKLPSATPSAAAPRPAAPSRALPTSAEVAPATTPSLPRPTRPAPLPLPGSGAIPPRAERPQLPTQTVPVARSLPMPATNSPVQHINPVEDEPQSVMPVWDQEPMTAVDQQPVPVAQAPKPKVKTKRSATKSPAKKSQHGNFYEFPGTYPTGSRGPAPAPSGNKAPAKPKNKILIGALIVGGVALTGGSFALVPSLFANSASIIAADGSGNGGSDLDGAGEGTAISDESKITFEDLETDDYVGIREDNRDQGENSIDGNMSVHRWSYDWGSNEYDDATFTKQGYSNKDHTAYAFFNTFPADSIDDEEAFKEQVTKLAEEIDAQYGLGGVKGFSELETNHTGDFRIGSYHNGGGENGGIEAMTIFNISGNRVVTGTVLLTGELGRLDYQQMAVGALEVKATSD